MNITKSELSKLLKSNQIIEDYLFDLRKMFTQDTKTRLDDIITEAHVNIKLIIDLVDRESKL